MQSLSHIRVTYKTLKFNSYYVLWYIMIYLSGLIFFENTFESNVHIRLSGNDNILASGTAYMHSFEVCAHSIAAWAYAAR